MTAFPAVFMTAVSVTYILTAGEGFRLDYTVSCIAGASVAFALFCLYCVMLIKQIKIRKKDL